jgi:hypothetical protein
MAIPAEKATAVTKAGRLMMMANKEAVPHDGTAVLYKNVTCPFSVQILVIQKNLFQENSVLRDLTSVVDGALSYLSFF